MQQPLRRKTLPVRKANCACGALIAIKIASREVCFLDKRQAACLGRPCGRHGRVTTRSIRKEKRTPSAGVSARGPLAVCRLGQSMGLVVMGFGGPPAWPKRALLGTPHRDLV